MTPYGYFFMGGYVWAMIDLGDTIFEILGADFELDGRYDGFNLAMDFVGRKMRVQSIVECWAEELV